MYDGFVKELYKKATKPGKVHLLKNCNEKGKCWVQNAGEKVIKMLHKAAYKILKKNMILAQDTPGVSLKLRI